MNRRTICSKDFVLVAIGQIISIFGNQILRYALPLYLLNQTGSSVLFGTILAVSFIPMIILFPIGGIIADRVNKRNIMVILDFATAALILVFYVLSGYLDMIPLMAVTMMILYGIQGAYQPAVKASVPALVDPEYMMQANSVVDMISSVAGMAGPVIGGLLFSVLGLNPILWISMVCFFASAVMEIFIHIPFERKEVTGNIVATGFHDLRDSFHFMLKKRPVLWKTAIIFAVTNLLLTSLVLIGLPVILTQHLGFAADTASRLYGYAQGVIAGGAILGGLLAGILSKHLSAKAAPMLLAGCCLSVILGGIALQLAGNPMITYILMLVGCGLLLTLHTLFQIQVMTYLQLLTPPDLIGKVISCFMCVVMCTSPLGQFIYGMVFEHIGSSTYIPFYAAGLLMLVITVAARKIFYNLDEAQKESESEVADLDPDPEFPIGIIH